MKISTGLFLSVLTLGMILYPPVGSIICGAIVLLSLLLMVNGYSIQGGNIVVHGLLWRKAFDLCELESIWVEPYVNQKSIRSFGIGGLFSSMGYFNSPTLGNYLGYMTDSQNCVVVDFVNLRLVLTPADPDAFRSAVMAEYRRIHI